MDIDTVEFSINKCLGIDSNGNVVIGGLIQRLNLSKDKTEYIKTFCSNSMNNGVSWSEMWCNIDKNYLEIKETEDNEPLNVFCQDITTIKHRLDKLADAQRLKMTHFIYSGGLKNNSRDFCVHNNGRIFSINEINQWADEPFAKNIPLYNPIIDFGGRGCHHVPDFISSVIARMKKDEFDKRADEKEKLHKLNNPK